MRVMVFVKATADSEAGKPPPKELFAEMGKFNEQLIQAGVLVDAGGLKPTRKCARVSIAPEGRTVIDGPFTESKELIAGYWLWEVKSLQEAIEWVKRCPNPHPGTTSVIELRPLMEASDFA